EGELGAFDLQMNELRSCRIEVIERKTFQQGQLLQHDRTLAPDARLAYRVAIIIIGQWRFDARLPARHVVSPQHATMRRAADVHDVLGATEFVDRLGDETARPGVARALDLRDAVGAG